MENAKSHVATDMKERERRTEEEHWRNMAIKTREYDSWGTYDWLWFNSFNLFRLKGPVTLASNTRLWTKSLSPEMHEKKKRKSMKKIFIHFLLLHRTSRHFTLLVHLYTLFSSQGPFLSNIFLFLLVLFFLEDWKFSEKSNKRRTLWLLSGNNSEYGARKSSIIFPVPFTSFYILYNTALTTVWET